MMAIMGLQVMVVEMLVGIVPVYGDPWPLMVMVAVIEFSPGDYYSLISWLFGCWPGVGAVTSVRLFGRRSNDDWWAVVTPNGAP